MTKKKKIFITVLIIFLLVTGIVGVLYFTRHDDKKEIVKQEDVIKDYNYSLKEHDSNLKKEKFKELKNILSNSPINYDEYAKKLAEIFVVDVYDLNSKVNKYDVGGLEYVLEEKKDTLKLILQDSLYGNLKDNSNNNRQQDLPVILKALSEEPTTDKYTYSNTSYDAYVVNVLIDYEKDLGYDKNVQIKMIKKDSKLFVVQVEPK